MKRTSPKVDQQDNMTWPTAMQAVINGKRITRKEWGNDSVCVFMADEFLKLRKAEGTLHVLMVSSGDMLATDWMVVREN